MPLEKSLNFIKEFLVNRYEDNLAAILLFGTANTGQFKEGESDIDTMVFLKEQRGLNIENEIKFLFDALKSEKFSIQYFNTLEGIIQYIKERVSFSTYITIVGKDSSRILYSTSEFEETRQKLRENPPSKENLKKYVKRKDDVELNGYFKELEGFKLTKALFSHIRRKLQILNYFKTGELIFDYGKFIDNLGLSDAEVGEIDLLYKNYFSRESLSSDKIQKYYQLAEGFTERIERFKK